MERLAAIADETPTPGEATHLASCWDCRAEVAAYRRLARMSAMAPLPTEPLTAWSQLAPQLRAEGLIAELARDAGAAADSPIARDSDAAVLPFIQADAKKPNLQVWALRTAAGFTLIVGGALAGRMSAGVPLGVDKQEFTAALPVAERLQVPKVPAAARLRLWTASVAT
jgi:hypothetical protein